MAAAVTANTFEMIILDICSWHPVFRPFFLFTSFQAFYMDRTHQFFQRQFFLLFSKIFKHSFLVLYFDTLSKFSFFEKHLLEFVEWTKCAKFDRNLKIQFSILIFTLSWKKEGRKQSMNLYIKSFWGLFRMFSPRFYVASFVFSTLLCRFKSKLCTEEKVTKTSLKIVYQAVWKVNLLDLIWIWFTIQNLKKNSSRNFLNPGRVVSSCVWLHR